MLLSSSHPSTQPLPRFASLIAEFPGEFGKIHEYVKGENYRKSFQETGDTENSIWSCGEVMGLIDDIPTCETLMENMVAEAEEALLTGPSFISK